VDSTLRNGEKERALTVDRRGLTVGSTLRHGRTERALAVDSTEARRSGAGTGGGQHPEAWRNGADTDVGEH